MQNSIKLRTRSDVPLTICLSGGVDASVIASYCVKKLNLNIKTFSIVDNDERYNEIKNIKTLLKDLKCKNKVININKKNFLEQLSDLVKYHRLTISESRTIFALSVNERRKKRQI